MDTLSVINVILVFLSQALRIIGLAALGVALGWLILDLLKKAETWYMQAILFLGLLGLVIAMVVFTGWGALGAFAIGLAVAIFLWGIPRKVKVEEEH
jgi:NhaP-type Na+/H+ or K+/H+ antiporter